MAKFKLNNLLDFYNLNQKDLSDGTGINKNTINRYCNNTFDKITKEHLDLILSFFKCSLEDIIEVKSDIEIKYPSEMVKNMIESYKVMQKLAPDDFKNIVTETDETSKISSQVIRSNKSKLSGREAIKIKEQIEIEIQKQIGEEIRNIIEQKTKEYINDALDKIFDKYKNEEPNIILKTNQTVIGEDISPNVKLKLKNDIDISSPIQRKINILNQKD